MVLLLTAAPLIAEILDGLFRGLFSGSFQFAFDFDYQNCVSRFIDEPMRMKLFFVFSVFLFLGLIMLLYRARPEIGKAEVMEVAKGIVIPVPAGNGEYGTAHFMDENDMQKEFQVAVHSGKNKVKNLKKEAGIIVNYERKGGKEYYYYLSEPVNTIVLGATRSGKGRRILLQSIWLDILAEVNLLVIDVKGEMFAYTSKFARERGYEVRTLDFRHPEKSNYFNNLEEINQLLRDGKISQAVNKAWDIVTVLVGEPQGERIWNDGQCATIVAAILIVAQDAPEHCKNLANVYYFLAYMCESDPETGDMPITDYMNNLPANHPARGAFQIAKIAPFRTRSSFFTSALATLRLFTDWNIADITSKSDYSLDDIDEKKVITYIIIHDEKTTFHPIGAIYMKQLYESLVAQADTKGGELDRRFIFRADEVGNFPVIPGLGPMLSAGAGRNIFFELIIQAYQQMNKKYKEDFENIITNSQLTICIKATAEETTKSLSNLLGTYTVRTESSSASISDGRNDSTSYSSNKNLTSRPLLFAEEISNIKKPDALILYGGEKAIVNLPDISKTKVNKIFGMGSKEHNRKLILKRMEERPSREIGEPRLWGIWEDYGLESSREDVEEVVSFLG